jgi:hypothetical protein
MLKALIPCFVGGDRNGPYVIPQIAVHNIICHLEKIVQNAECDVERLVEEYEVPLDSKAEAAAKAAQS